MKPFLKLLTASLLLIVAVWGGCKKEDPPVPNFSFSGDNRPAPCEVAFTNLSSKFTSVKWEFGDGGASTENDPKHTYSVARTFTVKLTAIGDGGEADITYTVLILDPVPNPVADFSFTGTDGFAPLTVSFTNKSLNAVRYSWDFGDGQASTDINPSHLYSIGGTFNVTLTAKNHLDVPNVISKSVVIATAPNPVADFSFTGADGYAPLTVSFTNKSVNAVSYTWDFGDGQISTEVNPSHRYNIGGTFNVALTAKSSINITNVITKSIVIATPPNPIADFSFSGSDGFAPRTVSFTNKSQNAITYTWDFGDGQSSTDVNPSHLFSTGGTFNVSLTARNSLNVTNVISKSVVIATTPNPVADFSFAGNDGFAPRTVTFTNKSVNAVSYTWDFGDGQSSTEVNPSHLYSNGGTFNVSLTAKNSVNASSSISKSVAIASSPDPVADFSFTGDNVFAPRTVSFTNKSTGAVSYSWDFGDGNSSNIQNPKHEFWSGGTFNVTLTATNQNGISNKISKAVVIKQPPTKMIITSVVLTKMPFTNSSGVGWDAQTGPDVYFRILDDNSNEYFESGTAWDIGTAAIPLTFTTGLPYAVTNLDLKFKLRFYDNDTPFGSDIIGDLNFKVRDYMKIDGYPSSIGFGDQSSALRFTLNVTWQ